MKTYVFEDDKDRVYVVDAPDMFAAKRLVCQRSSEVSEDELALLDVIVGEATA